MKAIRVKEFGAPEVLCLEEVDELNPGPNQVLIDIRAAGVNPVETYIRSGNYARLPQLPYTPGNDGAGVVEAVGPGVTAFKPGDQVYVAGSLTGTMADEAPSHTSALIPTTTTRTTSITGTARATRTIHPRMAATATCLRIPSLKPASGRTVCSTVAPHALTRAERTLSLGWGPPRLPFASRRRD